MRIIIFRSFSKNKIIEPYRGPFFFGQNDRGPLDGTKRRSGTLPVHVPRQQKKTDGKRSGGPVLWYLCKTEPNPYLSSHLVTGFKLGVETPFDLDLHLCPG